MHASTAGTKRVTKTPDDPSSLSFLPVLVADVATRTMMNCFYVLKVGQQTSKGSISLEQVGSWYRYEKLGGLFRGNIAACVRLLPFSYIKNLTHRVLANSTRRFGSGTQWTLAVEGISTIAAAVATYPLNTLQTRMTMEPPETARYTDIIRGMAREPAGLIGGLWAGWLLVLPGNLFYQLGWYLSDKLLDLVGFPTPKVVDTNTFVRNALQSTFAHILAHPFDTICVRMQLGMADSIKECIAETYKNEGVLGFYKGLGVTLVKVLPFAVLMYGTFRLSKRWFNQRSKYYRYFQAFRNAFSQNVGTSLE